VNLLYRDLTLGGVWTQVPMVRIGQGRTAAENLFEVEGIALPGSEIELVFNDTNARYDNAPAPPQNTAQNAAPAIPYPYQGLTAPYNYRTKLDVFVVQDGQIYNYMPPATVSAPTLVDRFVNSTVAGIPGRNIHIYLPRGYTQNTSKRYPVAYFHDGQNVFFPNGAFGCWDADRIATYETSMGRMRETIIVAVDNADNYGSTRQVEYIPPTDQISARPVGIADKYLQFLRDNVLPTLDYNYRTLNQPGQSARPAENVVVGSSLGGLVSAYIGTTGSSTFGKIGVVSPAFWAAPNFMSGAFVTAPKLPLRIYMDMGTNESSGLQSSSNIYWSAALSAYNQWLGDGYAVNSEMLFYPDCGGIHNESNWSRRLPAFYSFILNPWDEPNSIALAKFPPQPQILNPNPTAGTARIRFLAPLGVRFTLSRSSNLSSWPDQSTLQAANGLWEDWTLDITCPVNGNSFWRLLY
jgi:predicted alpha/beta superfamily hydrolase